MNRRLRFGPPNVRLAHTSGRRIRPSSLPSGEWTVTPLYPTLFPALLLHHRLPYTSVRIPSGAHRIPSTSKLATVATPVTVPVVVTSPATTPPRATRYSFR